MNMALRWGMRAYYALALGLPALVLAQGTNMPSRIVPCDGADCTVCSLATLAQNIINTGVFLFVFFAAIMFAFAGFLMLTDAGNPGQHNKAKEIFVGVTKGLVILLVAWLIVDTLMKSLLGSSFGPWNDICRVLN